MLPELVLKLYFFLYKKKQQFIIFLCNAFCVDGDSSYYLEHSYCLQSLLQIKLILIVE